MDVKAAPLGSHPLGHAMAFLAAISWATTGIFIRWLDHYDAFTLLASRYAVTLIVVGGWVMMTRQGNRLARTLTSPVAWQLAALMAGYYFFAVEGFVHAPVAEVALLIAIAPALVIAFNLATGRPVHRNELCGAATALVGLGIVFVPDIAAGGATYSGSRALGHLSSLAAAVTTAAYAILYRDARADQAPSAPAATAMAGGLGLAGMAVVWIGGGFGPLPVTVTAIDVALLVIGLGGVATIVPTLSFSLASKYLPAVTATTIRLLTPLLAAGLAILFLGEWPAIWFWIGAAVVLIGLWLTVAR